MTNRISAVVASETVAQALKCIEDLKGLMPFLVVADKNARTKNKTWVNLD